MSSSENIRTQYLACECGETFGDEKSFETHFQLKHTRRTLSLTRATKPPPPIIDYKCGECGQIYPTEEACVEHQEIEHIPFMEDFAIQEEEEEDIEDFITPDVIVAPTTSQSSSTPSDQPPEDSEERKTKPKKKRDQRKTVVCETCGKNYSSNAALWYHRKVHLAVKPYKCTYCPKAFTLKLYLQMHIRTHTGEKPYQCPNCPKAFSNRGALVRHDLVHTGVKPYQCPKCDKGFKQSNAMKLHYHTVHLKLPTPYKYDRKRGKAVGTGKRTALVEENESQDQFPKPDSEADPNACYIETKSGRTITLTTIVPKKTQQQVDEIEPVKSEPEEETYYFASEPYAEEEAVTYEIIYDTNNTEYIETTTT